VGGSAYAAPAEAPKQVYIFNQLQIFEQVAPADTRPSRSNESEVPINTVRSGGLVHVQIGEQAEEEYGSAFARRAEVCFFKLLHGSIRTQRGVLKMFPTVRSELVLAIKDPTEQLTLGSLRENLLYGLTCETKPDDKQLWDACSYLGLSKALIGEEYAEGWAKTKLSAILSWASPVDLCKLVLVRALLRCPDLLLLYHVGDSWCESEQLELVNLVHQFCSTDGREGRELWRLTHQHLPESRRLGMGGVERTVLWCTSDSNLLKLLARQRRRMLSLKSPRRAVLSVVQGAIEPLEA